MKKMFKGLWSTNTGQMYLIAFVAYSIAHISGIAIYININVIVTLSIIITTIRHASFLCVKKGFILLLVLFNLLPLFPWVTFFYFASIAAKTVEGGKKSGEIKAEKEGSEKVSNNT